MKKKKQHTIPQCYLKAWCDPMCPSDQEPYIWIISKDGERKRKRAPKKAFTETDMYTVKLPNGDRELIIEDTLSKIEDAFARIIETKIKKQLPLSGEERAKLCVFVAAMSVRTKAQQSSFRTTFGEVHDMVESMEKEHGIPPKTSLETKLMRDYAYPISISNVLKIMPPILYEMSLAIFVTKDDLGFITSDSPCIWFNPEMHKWPPFYRHPGLGQPKVEVTLPLTPHHLLFISWSNIQGYLSAPINLVDEINRRTRAHCNDYFISWKGNTKPIWFEMGEMPKDAWEKQQK